MAPLILKIRISWRLMVRFTPRLLLKKSSVMGVPQSCSGFRKEAKNILPLPGINSQFPRPAVA
jgi:hypothetical protein